MLKKYMLYRVVKTLIKKPSEKLTLKSLAKSAKVSVSTSKRCLDFLEAKDIVRREKVGNVHQFQLKNESPVVRQLKVLNTVSKLVYSGFLDELISKLSPISIILYGSCAKGSNDEGSDIDLLVVTLKKEKEIHLETTLDQEYNYQVYSIKEWKQKAKKDKVFYENVIIDSISLYGEKPVVK